ncbi:MAG: serine/threonine protein kinase [Akkermansiaceae bacterium]
MNDVPLSNTCTPLSPEELTKLLPGYQIDSIVSSSVTGTLYAGTQISLDRSIAIKVLPSQTEENPTFHQAFEKDAKAMARLKHANLVEVLDFGNLDGMLYTITDHISGSSLYETTHRQCVDQIEAAKLIADICRGLDHAHQAGVIHLRLNPKNILINNDAEAKIIDFGLSSFNLTDQEEELVDYCAPELFQTENPCDFRADIYSIGIILYELVVGCVPSNPYTPPSDVREISETIDYVIFRALQEDPASRYASAAEMADELETFLAQFPLAGDDLPQQETSPSRIDTGRNPVHTLPIRKLSNAKSSNHFAILVTFIIIAAICYVGYRYYLDHVKDIPAPEKDKSKPEMILRDI